LNVDHLDNKWDRYFFSIYQIQTPGGAWFQEGTVCTIATYEAENLENGGGAIGYSSRRDSPDGSFVNATGMLDYIYHHVLCFRMLQIIKKRSGI